MVAPPLAALYPIIHLEDRAALPRARDLVEAVLAAGAPWLQLRCKRLPARDHVEIARELVRRAEGYGARVIVNDRVDVAVASGAAGVHLGQADLPLTAARELLGRSGVVGVSTHTLEEAIRAEAEGADYLGFGPLYPTASKSDALSPRRPGELARLRAAVSIPIVAIGGIDEARAGAALDAGADAVAMIGALESAADPRALAERILDLRAGRGPHGSSRPGH